jgi:tryptophan halogenase
MRTKRVLIVGGGSSGWTAAAFLNAKLNSGKQKVAEISLVESPDVPRIGVGEATIPNINSVLAVIGIDELEFMRAVDGTFKQSIRFNNWLVNDLKNPRNFYHHPFCRYGGGPTYDPGLSWLKSDRSAPFMNTVSAQPAICEMKLSPKMLGKENSGFPLVYAFHMNALKYADYLCAFATQRGVTHYLDNVVGADLHENGDIAAVQTQSGNRLEADLFVDCTGFAAHLIEKKLDVDFRDLSQWLICDRAITMRVPYEHHYAGYVNPYTTSTALSAGWVWDIPLQTNRSLGYVHSSAHISEDEAEQELRAFEGSHSRGLPSQVVKFKVGMREQQWARNCVAIGLSAGFIEPLESTGLYLSQVATDLLAEHFPLSDNGFEDMASMAFRFNRIMTNRYYEILDFINMHYCLTRREDTEFWREIRRPERINDRLRAKLDYWRLKPPTVSDFSDQFFPNMSPVVAQTLGDGRVPVDTGALWNHHSYENVLYGMDFLRDECNEMFGKNRPRPTMLKAVHDAINGVPAKHPPHDAWLKRMVGMADYPVRR